LSVKAATPEAIQDVRLGDVAMGKQKFRIRGAIWCTLAPFFVAATLFVLMLLNPLLGTIDPSSNTFVLLAMSAIFSGVIVGAASLLMTHSLALWARLTIGLFYVPAVIFSLVLSGL
jgi:hypothetical protein